MIRGIEEGKVNVHAIPVLIIVSPEEEYANVVIPLSLLSIAVIIGVETHGG
jgi:hypothetical protein